MASDLSNALPIGPEHPWLAPLAGFTDLPFRLLCRELGAAVACTEMVSAKGLILGQGRKSGATESYLATVPPLNPPPDLPCTLPYDALPADLTPDRPLVVQLFGSEASFLERAVESLVARGYTHFDLNMGCPVPKVGKNGAGSAMLREIPNALAVARSMIAAAIPGSGEPGRVGFKLRLGWQAGEEVYLELGKALEDLGAGWLTLHPRYARQQFSGRADWSHIARLKERVSIPVIASGDLFTAADAVACLKETGADGVMFARGALADPAVFARFRRLVRGDEAALAEGPSPRFPEGVIRRHIALVRALLPLRRNSQGLETGLLRMRTVIPRYVRHIPGARALRQALVRCVDWAGLDALLTDFFDAERRSTAASGSGTLSEID